MTKTPRAFLDSPRPMAFAHRGGSLVWPENTLVAFEGALSAGCQYLETDLHLTRDGAIVAFHDARLDRTTDGTGNLRDFTLAELRRLDAAHRFTTDDRTFPFRGRGLKIPTFEELLELSSTARFNIEIKQRDPPMVQKLCDFIEARGLHDRLLVAAAKDDLVRDFRRRSRGTVATSAGAWEARLFWAASRVGMTSIVPVAYEALQVPPSSGALTVVDEKLVLAAHARGLHVHVWTIDEEHEMTRLLELGVDGLMSDRPDRLMPVVREAWALREGGTRPLKHVSDIVPL